MNCLYDLVSVQIKIERYSHLPVLYKCRQPHEIYTNFNIFVL